MFFKRYHLVLIMRMSKLFVFRHRKCLVFERHRRCLEKKNEVGWLSLPGLETKTENFIFVYAKTPKICDLIGQIIVCAKECVFELVWRCQFWSGGILHFT